MTRSQPSSPFARDGIKVYSSLRLHGAPWRSRKLSDTPSRMAGSHDSTRPAASRLGRSASRSASGVCCSAGCTLTFASSVTAPSGTCRCSLCCLYLWAVHRGSHRCRRVTNLRRMTRMTRGTGIKVRVHGRYCRGIIEHTCRRRRIGTSRRASAP